MNEQERSHLRTEWWIFNAGIILLSTSGVLGRAIETSSTLTILYRALISAIILMSILLFIQKRRPKWVWADLPHLILSSVLLGGHWLTYFYSLDYSSVAIALISLYTFPMMTTFLEPIILKTRLHYVDVLLGVLVIIGVYIMVPSFDPKDTRTFAIILGLISAFLYSLRNIYVRKISHRYDDITLMAYQLIGIAVFLLPSMFFLGIGDLQNDWWKLILLSLVTTVVAHTLFVRGLRNFSANKVGLMASIVPFYGILWGVIFLNEQPNIRTLIGGAIIIFVVVVKSVHKDY